MPPCGKRSLRYMDHFQLCISWVFSFVEIMEFMSTGRGEKQQRGNKFHEFQEYFEQSIIKVASKEKKSAKPFQHADPQVPEVT